MIDFKLKQYHHLRVFSQGMLCVLMAFGVLLPTAFADQDGHQPSTHKHGPGFVDESTSEATLSEAAVCPVMPGEPLDDRYSLRYGEETVTFCCAQCQRAFERDPEPYLAALTPAVAAAVRAKESSPQDPKVVIDLRIENHLDLVALIVVVLVALILWRRGRRSAALALVVVGLIVAVGLANWRATTHLAALAEVEEELRLMRLQELIHNNTFYDYGDPPRPLRPPVPPRLQATFYRGNDERSPDLWNGGHYLTSTFEVSVMDAYGEPLTPGHDVSGQQLWLRFDIRRGPHTPDFFWTPDILGDIFLTTNADPLLGYERPVTDRADLETLEEMNAWRAEYALGSLKGVGAESLERVVYVADAWHEADHMVGATFHYGIVVQLDASDGRLEDSSDVYMGALFRPRKSPISRVPREEWLSHEPIPPLPSPQGDDPETLGISDYLD